MKFSIHYVSAYVTDAKLISDDIRTIERSADVVINAFRDIGLTLNIGKTKFIEVGRHRSIVTNEYIIIGSNYCERVKIFQYLGSLLTNENYNQEEIKC